LRRIIPFRRDCHARGDGLPEKADQPPEDRGQGEGQSQQIDRNGGAAQPSAPAARHEQQPGQRGQHRHDRDRMFAQRRGQGGVHAAAPDQQRAVGRQGTPARMAAIVLRAMGVPYVELGDLFSLISIGEIKRELDRLPCNTRKLEPAARSAVYDMRGPGGSFGRTDYGSPSVPLPPLREVSPS